MSEIKQHGSITGRKVPRGSIKGTIAKKVERIKPNIEPLTVAENGEYNAPDGVHGFNPVNVNVPLKYDEGYADGYKASQDSIKLQEKTATENGDVVADEGFTALKKVTVAVPIKAEQEKTLEITKNGTFEVAADEGKVMSKVTANVNVAFEGDIGKPYIDTSKITSFYYFCCNDRMNNYLDKLDTSNGTLFTYIFANCQALKTIPPLDTSRGTEFDRMFNGCTELETVSQLDTSNGRRFVGMFASCASLKTIPPLDTSKGTNFGYMFSSCTILETVSLTTAKSDLATNTFQGCTALQNITIGEGWAVNIYLHYSNNLTVESLHGMIENLADLTGKTAKTFQIGATNLAKLDDEHRAMLAAKNWAYS